MIRKLLRTFAPATCVVGLTVLSSGAGRAFAADAHAGHGMMHAMAPATAAAGDPYLLPTDPVTGEKLGAHAVVVNHEGRELRFASKENAEQFMANPKTYLAKVDRQMIEQQKPLYPLTTCVVTDEKLGGMGDGVDVIYKNRLVRLCCEGCQKDFAKDPAKYLKKIDDAVIKAQKANYPLKECVVTGEALDSMGDGVNYVIGNRLVRFCCSGCIKKFNQDPAAYLAKLGSGPKQQASSGDSHAGHMQH